MNANEFAEVFPVGDLLAEEIETRGWTQSDFAAILGRPAQFVSEILAGKKEITRESAAQIGAALGTSAELWLHNQDAYHLWRQSKDAGTQSELNEVRRRATLSERVPVALLVKRGFIAAGPVAQQERDIAELYGVENFDPNSFSIAARRTNVDDSLAPVQLAWVRCVRKVALERMPAQPYSPYGLQQLAASLSKDLALVDAFVGLPARFAEVGVKLVFVESFPGSRLDGCTFLLDGVPVIGLSGRGQRMDKVLFTLMHEIAHILLDHLDHHDVIVDELDRDMPVGNESEADQQAAKWIVSDPMPDRIPARVGHDWVAAHAAARGIHPILIVGRLQKMGKIGWKTSLVRGAPNVIEHMRRWP